MSGWIVRHGVAADAAALAEFGARTFADAYRALNRPEDMRAHLGASFGVAQQTRELADPAAITLLAHDREILVAYARVRRGANPPCIDHARPVELQRFYVDRSAHGGGGAKVLMGLVQEAARLLGGQHLWLSVWERNPRAIAIYRKMGFTEAGTTEFRVGADRQHDRVYALPLAAVPQAAARGGVYHLTGEADFRAGLDGAQYRPANLGTDGFVHCALAPSVIPVASDFFAGLGEPLLVLAIDPRRLHAETRYEAPAPIAGGGSSHLSDAVLFPHVYGPIDTEAITGVGVMRRTADGYGWPRRLRRLQSFLDGR